MRGGGLGTYIQRLFGANALPLQPTEPEWDYLSWAEHAALENLRERLEIADGLRKEANTLITVLLAGIGGSLAFAFKGLEQPQSHLSPAVIGALAVAVWLVAIGAIVMIKCVVTGSQPPLFNEPRNIYRPELQLSPRQIRSFELENIQGRIDEAKAGGGRGLSTGCGGRQSRRFGLGCGNGLVAINSPALLCPAPYGEHVSALCSSTPTRRCPAALSRPHVSGSVGLTYLGRSSFEAPGAMARAGRARLESDTAARQSPPDPTEQIPPDHCTSPRRARVARQEPKAAAA